ncbi:MAG: MBL fold metallo-hydrolase [Armatimonadota bacterium]|nr:MBL fold metallo-hydrolase [Armatimonadota bacterium]MDR7444382.1 MBL fold metallo-hydrolase [Armatimonadota bacterium]MDR7570739.1 MBL fold metallo-hydrolase [Armatimonadota bacterium]MDR7614869.1 MBL fold metallo-hydrolase [Armatimonadota bacterium]
MRIAEGVEVLSVDGVWRGNPMRVHPVLLREGDQIVLVDTAFPGQVEALRQAIRACGVEISQIRTVLLTHQDLDHIGNAPALVRESGAEVWAHPEEVPYIEGARTLLKFDPARLSPEQREALDPVLRDRPRVKVTRYLVDGERLPLCGGVRVVHTPGHTPGHLSLFLELPRILISGDALVVTDGQLRGPIPEFTPDRATAMASVRKLADLEPDVVVCYHGGVYGPGAARRLRELAVGD